MAELPVIFDYNPGEDGLADFEPEVQKAPLWLREESPAVVEVQRWKPDVAPPTSRRWPFVLAVVAVVVVAVIAGAVGAWRPGTPVKNVVPEVSSRLPREVPIAPPVRPATAKPAATALPAQPATARIDPTFEQTLARVSEAYRTRDAQSLASVWPDADTAALSRAFADLKYQTLSFDHCAVMHPGGTSGAVATCDVLIATAAKAGDQALQRRHESWTLRLDRSGDRWTITGVSVR